MKSTAILKVTLSPGMPVVWPSVFLYRLILSVRGLNALAASAEAWTGTVVPWEFFTVPSKTATFLMSRSLE